MSSIGERLRKARIKKELTQAEVARRLGVTRSVITRYESGINDPPTENLIKLAEIYKVSPNYFFGLSEGKDLKSAPDLNAPLREKSRADALLKISELDTEFNLPDEVILSLIKKVREKYGPLPREGGIAAHGPDQPGTNALREEDYD